MSKTLKVSPRRRGERRWPVILHDDANGLLTGGMTVASYTELEALALLWSARVECPRGARKQMLDAGVGPTPLAAQDEQTPLLPQTDQDRPH